MLLPEPCQRRILSHGEGLRRPKAKGLRRRPAGGRSPEGGREGGESRGKRVGESIPDGWRPEASPPAGRNPEAKASVETICLPSRRAKLCLCLSLTQTLSHTERRRDRNSKNLIVRRDAEVQV